jgi:hypothetical protein
MLINDTWLGKWKSMHCHPWNLLDGSALRIGKNVVKWEWWGTSNLRGYDHSQTSQKPC